MTKRREPLTYHRTLTHIAALIGWDRCAAICGVSERTVRYWSDPDCETEIRLIDAERLDRAYMELGGDHAPFHRLFALRLDIAAREAEAERNIATLAAETAKESGEGIAALIAVSTDPSCPATRRKARKELQEAVDTLTDALVAIDQLGTRG